MECAKYINIDKRRFNVGSASRQVVKIEEKDSTGDFRTYLENKKHNFFFFLQNVNNMELKD
jgi:hypothetical protein